MLKLNILGNKAIKIQFNGWKMKTIFILEDKIIMFQVLQEVNGLILLKLISMEEISVFESIKSML